MARIKIFLSLLLLCAFLPVLLEAQSGTGAAQAAVLYERGRYYMAEEDWYSAVESFLECVRLHPAHAEGNAALAECYYELSEFDEALVWIKKARSLSRGSMALANLEAFILIALGQIEPAAALVGDILAREPYNREALFAAGELDIARGRQAEALLRFREAVRRYPDDRRLLVSLALVSGSLGDNETALSYIDRALAQHPDDHRVFYYAAYLNAQSNRLAQAIRYAENSLYFKPGYKPALSLLANLRYRNGQFDEAARLADAAIEADRQDSGAWYLKGLSFSRLGRSGDSLTVLSNAIATNGEDEFIRAILEETLISSTNLEDPRRTRWATWHFERGRDFRSRNMIEQALFEYRRGLRLNPYSNDRREYAELLRLQGYPARYLEELRFMQDQGSADRSMNDAVEAYSSLLSNAVFRQWQVDPVELAQRYWKVAVFSIAGQSSFYHADSGYVASSYINEILIHDRNISRINIEVRQTSFSQAFRLAREAGADYFMIVSVTENERDISLKGELFVGRTGSSAGVFTTYRTGIDRLRNACRGITEQLSASLPFRGSLVNRRQNLALFDKGRADGVQTGTVFDVVKKGRTQIANEGIALVYGGDDVVGSINIDICDEEISVGTLTRSGFFDRIERGDEIILQREGAARSQSEAAANPELRALLRTLR
ncbi:MAG: tetratricopeptide repeat protein [Treponema sp.]|nr:tetratricopeptide repeat protein [Treponema sp.]